MNPGQTTLPGARSITSPPAGASRVPIEAMTGPSMSTSPGTVVAPIPSATRPPRSSIGVDSGRSPLRAPAGPAPQPESTLGPVTNGGPGTPCEEQLLHTLAGVGETVLIYPSTGGRPKARRTITEMTPPSSNYSTCSAWAPTPPALNQV